MTSDPIRTVPPSVLPLGLAEMKAQARVDTADEEALMMGYLRAAVEWAENEAGLGLITQTFEQRFSGFADELALRRRPLQEVLSVEYLDADDQLQTLDASVYRVAGVASQKRPAVIRLGHNQSWPSVLDDAEAVRVTYKVGFGDDQNAVPELIRQAIQMAAATWYDFRQDVTEERLVEVPFASKALLRDWRPLAVA